MFRDLQMAADIFQEELTDQPFGANEYSPSHESDFSDFLSPTRSVENELEHDADSDSSGEDRVFENKARGQEIKKKLKRRTSSNVFTFKRHADNVHNMQKVNIDEFTELDLDLANTYKHLNSNSKQLFFQKKSHSFSSSTDENDSRTSSSKTLPLKANIESISSTSTEECDDLKHRSKKTSAVDGLLFEIYDRYHSHGELSHVVDSDITECSTTSFTSVYVASSFENDDRPRLDKSYLQTKEVEELEKMVRELKRGTNMLSSKLVRLLKQRDRSAHKIQDNFNVLTALLQAMSQKRRVDTRIRFSFIPRPGKRGFRQWVDAVKAVARIYPGVPAAWRKRTWLSLAEYFLKDADWEKIKRLCFNDRRNPDDDELDTQIVKDLHRTGCGWFFEHDTAEDRASLKRVLLAYARWNKSIGYCQGFNVIAALILQVMEGNEEHALKVMIFLVDYVLPRNYFANNLRALSVDMAVLRDLMLIKLPDLANHLQQLQKEAMDKSTNSTASYEPPLINMFTMQWFLTLFATCLPRNTVLRIWDTVLLEGSEILLRVALAIWAKLGTYFDNVLTASDFYMKMGKLIQELISDDFIDVQKLMQAVYQMAPFPWTCLIDLREKYTYDIHPFSTFTAEKDESKKIVNVKPVSDEEVAESEDEGMVGCLGFVSSQSDSPIKHRSRSEARKTMRQSKSDITKATPGAYITDQDTRNAYKAQIKEKEILRETEKMDLGKLRNQYGRMRRLQQKAMLVFNSNDFKDESNRLKNPPCAINHLFVDVSKVAPPRTRYRKPSNFPALKAPSKGTPSLKPVKESSSKIIHENDFSNSIMTTSQNNNRVNSSISPNVMADNASFTSPYVTREIQAIPDEPEAHAFSSCDDTASTPNTNSFHNNTKIQNTIHFNKKNDAELKSTSLLYQIDKSALYPSNFKPFPHRNSNARRKVR